MNKKLYTYQMIDSAGKSTPELLVQVYDGVVRKMRDAIAACKEGNDDAAQAALEKTKTVMVHLYTSLDNDKGGDIAVKLGQLYAYIVERIIYTQATKDTKTIEECIGILENIRSAWAELARQNNSETKQDKIENKPTRRLSVSV